MKTTKKALLALVCAAALVFGSVFATYAYLTDETEVVTNTFTVGKVEIELKETPVDEDGKAPVEPVAWEKRVTANTYKLVPGKSYDKDPTVRVAEDSEDAWLFVKVENGLAAYESNDNTIAHQMDENGWTVIDAENHIYAYESKVTAEDEIVVFEEFIVAGDADVEAAATHTITVTAYAVQGGFESAEEAWTTTFGKPAAE